MSLLNSRKSSMVTSLVVQGLRLCAPKARDKGSITGQGNRSHMSQLKIKQAAMKIEDPVCHDKDPPQQINKYYFLKIN